LIKVGPLTLHAYGFFVALGFLLAVLWTTREGRRRGVEPEIFHDLFFYVILSALIGARLFYVILNFAYFRHDLLAVFKLWEGGLVFYGGFLVAVPVFIQRLRKSSYKVLEILDIAAPALALAQAIGRLGCFSAGCCYGKPCDLFFAVKFSDPLSHAPLHVPLHPTQIYHTLANLLLFVLLVYVPRRFPVRGLAVALYLVFYSLFRFLVECFRGDPRGSFAGFSTSQWISVFLFGVGSCFLLYLFRKHSRNG